MSEDKMRVVTSCEIANFDRSSIEGMLTCEVGCHFC